MERTAFGRWLLRRGETPWHFARSRGYNLSSIYKMLGIARAPYHVSYWRGDLVTLISGETGISERRLKEEAAIVERDPVPPRPWRRQEDSNGTRTQAAE